MAIASPIQNSFNAGEFSPLTFGRADYPKYKNGLSLMQNFVPIVQGGAVRRTGTKYVNQSKLHGEVHLEPFIFSDGDAFLLEFGDQYIRFFRNRAPVLESSQAITDITQADPAVFTYVGADNFANGEEIFVDDITGMTEFNGTWIKVANVNVGANTFEAQTRAGVDIDSTGYTAYTSGGTLEEVYQIVSPYLLADVENLRMYELGDVIYIVHPDYEPRKLSRSGTTDWSFSTIVFSDGPYLSINTTDTTLTPAAITGSGITVTASAIVGINNGLGFQSTDVGRFMRIRHGATWGWAVIATWVSTTVVTVDIESDFGATTASTIWREGEWSATSGYPSVIFSFEDRLGYAASPIAPITINLSKTGDYDNMAPTAADSTVAADNSLQFKLNSRRQDPIRWVTDDEKGLLVGTKGAEWLIRSSVTGDAMSAINFPSARRSTRHGSANVEPVEAGKAKLFVQTAKRKLRELAFVYEVDGFNAPDLTVVAEHITKSGIRSLAYQQEPYNLVWTIREDGALVAMTYDREQDVVGWHRHPIGGFSDAAKETDVIIESHAVIPSPDGAQDDLWLSCKRYIDGQVVRYIEYLTEFNSDYDDVSDCYYVDGGLTIDLGSPGTAITGLDHLEGETVQLLVDGSPQPDQEVTNGALTLVTAGTIVHVGLQYFSRLKNLRIEAGSATGTAQGKIKRIHKLSALLHQTVGLRVGANFDNMDAQLFRRPSNAMSAAVPLFSGIKPIEYPSDYDFDGYICFEQKQPLPCTILAIMPQLHTQDAQ